jgi:single-strand DNA-binding protein
MSSFTLQGILKAKFAEQQVSEKFRKRDFVITDNSSQYPQHVTFQLLQDRCGLIDAFQLGQEIKVSFNIRGREWADPKSGETKYFNTVEAWRIESVSAGTSAPAPAVYPTTAPAQPSAENRPVETFISATSQEDDLPF